MTHGDEPITMLHNASLKDIVIDGLTKREYFAAMAMQGFVSQIIPNVEEVEYAASISVIAADELINALNEKP